LREKVGRGAARMRGVGAAAEGLQTGAAALACQDKD
jgi:hypothetical protein